MTRRLTVFVLTGALAIGCQSVEGDSPASDGYGTTVVRWASALAGPDILTVGGPAGAAPRCFRTMFPAQANVSIDVPASFAGSSAFPAETYAAIEALFTDEVVTVLRGDSDRLRSRPPGEVRLEMVISPSIDWRTGFPYSVQDVYPHYAGAPNSKRFPAYFTVDVTVYKTFEFREHKADLGMQFFNLTSHFNPRDVISVTESEQFGTFTNSFGLTLGGYMQVRWR